MKAATLDRPQIRNVVATPTERTGEQWVWRPIAQGIDARIFTLCREQRVEPLVAGCPSCRATSNWEMV